MNHCPVLDPRLDALIQPLKADLQASVGPSTTKTPRRASYVSWFCALVFPAENCFWVWWFATISSRRRWSSLSNGCSAGQSWWVVLNMRPAGNTLLGRKERLLAGRPWLMEFCPVVAFKSASAHFSKCITNKLKPWSLNCVQRFNCNLGSPG